MLDLREQKMGRFSVEVDLANNEDLIHAKRGTIRPDQVRQVRIRGVVDTGAARLVIPESIAKQLGLSAPTTAKVRYADGRTADRQIAQQVHLQYAGREGVFNAVVEPARDSALIGAIVLEDLDLIVDCTNT